MTQPRKTYKGRRFSLFVRAVVAAIEAYEDISGQRVLEEFAAIACIQVTSFQYYLYGRRIPPSEVVAEIARMAIKRAHFDRQWLEKFLECADYPFNKRADLMEELCSTSKNKAIREQSRSSALTA